VVLLDNLILCCAQPMIEEFEPYVLDDETYEAATALAAAATSPGSTATTTAARTVTSTSARPRGLGDSTDTVHAQLENVPTISPATRDRFARLDSDFDEANLSVKSDHPSTAGLFSCEPDSICLDSMSNSDVYHVDMGNQSLTEPKTLRLVVANHNPIQVRTGFDLYDPWRSLCP
jgi:hypothetical protein